MPPIAAWRERLAAARPTRSDRGRAEHFANFFMNNMPAFAMGMADRYEGPIEDPRVAEDCAHQGSRQRGAFAAADPRDHADGRSSPTPRNGSSTTASWCRCIS